MHGRVSQPQPPTPVPSVTSVILAYPNDGHNGDPIYLSGTGFRPRTHLQFLIACPKWDDPNLQFGFIDSISDANGGFLGVPLRGFQLTGTLAQSGSVCVIYVNYIGLPAAVIDTLPHGPYFVADFNALHYIEPPGVKLPPSSRSIQSVVTPRPKTVKAGLVERIHIARGWGGALARVTVTYPHVRPIVRTVQLDWKGEADVRVAIDGVGLQKELARVQVRCRLGGATGTSFASFEVVR